MGDPMNLRPIRHLAEYLVVRVAMSLIQAVSIETCATVTGWIAWLAVDVLRIRGRVVQENLRIAFPERDQPDRDRIARRMWRHLLLMVCEVAHLQRKIHETNWREFVDLRDGDRLARIALSDRASMLVSAHFGNFELGGFLLGILASKHHLFWYSIMKMNLRIREKK